jgi:DNA topoisomerase-1
MSKKYKTTTTLIIVESPAKCKKIEEYLGPGYKCLATYGHLRTLASLKDIDIENNFNPTFSLMDDSLKKKQIEILRREIKA